MTYLAYNWRTLLHSFLFNNLIFHMDFVLNES